MEIILSQNYMLEWKQREDFVFHFLLDYSYNSTKTHCLNSGKQIAGNCSTTRSFIHPVYRSVQSLMKNSWDTLMQKEVRIFLIL